jgi:phosphatidylserine/phosphatidylglycerophosphate/cardiolipin synthase-like enzyme
VTIQVKVYDNGDHTCLAWLTDDGKPIPQCRGFTARRLLNGTESYLHGFVGFSDTDTLDPSAPWKFPLQRFMWWDYGVKPGDKVQYSIVPVVGPDHNHLELASAQASALTDPMTITGQATAHVSAYFNKGIVAAQWVSRALAKLGTKPNWDTLIGTPGNDLRNALSGLLRPQILSLLADAKNNGGEIYAALYELNDPELIPALVALGQKCHLILANGAFKSGKPDENAAVRAQLRGKVDLHDRIVTGNHFAHNKFVVFCDSSGTPQSVLSGSTNWTKTGLCTQANNGIIVNDPALAADFVKEWNLLKDAGNLYPPTLAQANSSAQSFKVDGATITQWFVPTIAAHDLDFARKLISAAERGILFLFFNPGQFVADDQPEKWTLLQNILNRHHQGAADYNPGLYIRGVVNQEIANLTTESTTGPTKAAVLDPATPANPVTLFSGGDNPPQRLRYDSMVPKNIKDTFHDWKTEVLGSGVHVHSKVIVLDPFGANPVVMTGSHNLGFKASSVNDDNLMIIEGNAPLAAAYAANIIAIYQAYRWNAYVEAHRQDPQVWHGPVDNESWQDGYLQGDELAEIKFWLGTSSAGGPPGASPAPAGAPARSASASGPAPTQQGAGRPHRAATKKAASTKAKTKKAARGAAARKKASVRKKAPAKKKVPAKKTARAKKKA